MSQRIEPTKVSYVAALAVSVGLITWALVSNLYGDIPPLTWPMPVWIGVVALAEAVFAWTLRGRIQRKPGARPPEPLVAARALALAKASAYVGGALVGMWAGTAAYTMTQWGYLLTAKTDTVVAVAGIVLSIGLEAAALFLEYACRVPDLPDDLDDLD